jgi:hypothetical protein
MPAKLPNQSPVKLNMSSEFLWQLLSYVIFIAAIIGLLRFKKIIPVYRPFFYFVWWSALNEVVSTITSNIWHNNAVNSNIYVLFEFLLIIWLFRNINQVVYPKWFFPVTVISGVLFWILDNLAFHSIFTFNSLFRVFYSFIVVYLSIEEINSLLFYRGKSIIKNPKFMICFIFIIYFTYKAAFEVFFFVDFRMSKVFYIKLYDILVIVNLFSNILYGVVALCIPTKRTFILPY